MYVIMLLLGVNIYSPAGFVNVSSGIGTDLSLISYILLPVRTLNVVLSPPINILSLGPCQILYSIILDLVAPSTPQPTILTAWCPASRCLARLVRLYTPLLYISRSVWTLMTAWTGPWVSIS